MLFFCFNNPATTKIYTLSLHDALPISVTLQRGVVSVVYDPASGRLTGLNAPGGLGLADRKSTRLNSSHGYISYAVFCLKKKTKRNRHADPLITIARHIPHILPPIELAC